MSKSFDMELFLESVLTGSHTTRERHLRQAKAIQSAISNRWHRNNPRTWQQKHLAWFLDHHVNQRAVSTRYYYLLTIYLLTLRLGKPWQFKVLGAGRQPKPRSARCKSAEKSPDSAHRRGGKGARAWRSAFGCKGSSPAPNPP